MKNVVIRKITKIIKAPNRRLAIVLIVFTIFSCKGPTTENDITPLKDATITSFPLANDIKSDDFVSVLHQQYHLKPIKSNENGITIKSMPNKSYCYIDFNALSNKNKAQLNEVVISTKKDKKYYELQRFEKDRIYLLAFITYEAATNIANLDGKSTKELTFFSEKNPEYNHLAFIPLSRILEIKVRNIRLDNNDSLKVHDLRIK